MSDRTRMSLLSLLALLAAALLSACAARSSGTEALAGAVGPTGPNPRLKTASLAIGSAKIEVELALTEGEREKGLMFRKSLAEGKGMLFVFPADQRLGFWMQNTTIPLSIAYISSDGTIREIHELEPLSLSPVLSERSVRYALEVPRGWFERAGIKPGDSLDLSGLE